MHPQMSNIIGGAYFYESNERFAYEALAMCEKHGSAPKAMTAGAEYENALNLQADDRQRTNSLPAANNFSEKMLDKNGSNVYNINVHAVVAE